jgi:hypothetical protein
MFLILSLVATSEISAVSHSESLFKPRGHVGFSFHVQSFYEYNPMELQFKKAVNGQTSSGVFQIAVGDEHEACLLTKTSTKRVCLHGLEHTFLLASRDGTRKQRSAICRRKMETVKNRLFSSLNKNAPNIPSLSRSKEMGPSHGRTGAAADRADYLAGSQHHLQSVNYAPQRLKHDPQPTLVTNDVTAFVSLLVTFSLHAFVVPAWTKQRPFPLQIWLLCLLFTGSTASPTDTPTASPTKHPCNDGSGDCDTELWTVWYAKGSYGNTDVGISSFEPLFQASANSIVLRKCSNCAATHQHIFYKRITDIGTYNPYSVLIDAWVSTNNLLNTNFELFSTYDDAIAGINKWTWSNWL